MHHRLRAGRLPREPANESVARPLRSSVPSTACHDDCDADAPLCNSLRRDRRSGASPRGVLPPTSQSSSWVTTSRGPGRRPSMRRSTWPMDSARASTGNSILARRPCRPITTSGRHFSPSIRPRVRHSSMSTPSCSSGVRRTCPPSISTARSYPTGPPACTSARTPPSSTRTMQMGRSSATSPTS